MNIFATSACPVECALWLDDKRVNKMALETAQMLSTALNVKGRHTKGLYKSFNPNHPANLWTGETRGNFLWLCEHGLALCDVYESTSKREHDSKPIIVQALEMARYIPLGERTVFVNCAANKEYGLDFKHLPVLTAYRTYLNARWRRDKLRPTWKSRAVPDWKDVIL